MSHFTVLVPADDKDNLYVKLLPYYEYGSCEEDDKNVKPFLEWRDCTDAVREMFEDASGKAIRESRSTYLAHEADLVIGKDIDFVTFGDRYQDEYGRHPTEPGKYGYWHNPNAKWDWYSIGGRWTGMLILREEDGLSGFGDPGLGAMPKRGPSHADYARAGFVDWHGMLDASIGREMDRYHTYREGLKKAEKEGARNVLGDAEFARLIDYFDGQDNTAHDTFTSKEDFLLACAASNVCRKDHEMAMWATNTELAEMFYKDVDAYRAKFRMEGLTFAFIDMEGKWHERAHMGWFATTWDNNSHYDAEFWTFVESIHPNQMVYLVDCHI